MPDSLKGSLECQSKLVLLALICGSYQLKLDNYCLILSPLTGFKDLYYCELHQSPAILQMHIGGGDCLIGCRSVISNNSCARVVCFSVSCQLCLLHLWWIKKYFFFWSPHTYSQQLILVHRCMHRTLAHKGSDNFLLYKLIMKKKKSSADKKEAN